MRFSVVLVLLLMACAGKDVSGQGVHGFDRLEPISPYSINKIDVDLQKLLIKDKRPILWMISRSPFIPEYGISLSAVDSSEPTQKFRITVVRLSRPSWEVPSTKGQGRNPYVRAKRLGAISQIIEAPSAFAEVVIRAWRRGVVESRYRNHAYPPPTPTPVAYEFFAEDGYFGKSWGSESGMPALMVELAISLAAYTESPPEARNECLQNCLEVSERVLSYSFN